MQLSELRKELRFNSELVQLIETLKNIAASQYHAMEKAKQRYEQFMTAFAGFFRVINLVDVQDPLVQVCSDVTGLIMVTSDSGFMGGLNQGVIRAGLQATEGLPPDKRAIVMIGEKGASVLQDQGLSYRFFPGINPEMMYEQAVDVRDFVVDEVLKRRMGRVLLAYPRPVSFTAQTIEVIHLLPCASLFDVEADSEIARRTRTAQLIAEARRVIVESEFADVVEHLSGLWVASKLYEVFEDSKLAEFSARAMHLEGSFQRLRSDQKKLKHRTFKAVRERIDKGMRESFAARSKTRRGGAETAVPAAATDVESAGGGEHGRG